MKHLKYLSFFAMVVVLLLSCSKKTTEALDQCATPTFSPVAGTYSAPQTVTISSTIGATINYTTDGSNPSSSSPVFINPITITQTTTIKAQAFRDGWKNSAVGTASYTMNVPDGFVALPAGTFTMGDSRGIGFADEMPLHEVELSAFYMSKYEVTQGEWQAVMGSNPANSFGVGANYPVYNVSWYSVIKYCNLRSMQEGLTPVYTINGSTNPATWGSVPTTDNAVWNAVRCNLYANGYRLPTEAEWEYAARGASNTPDYIYSGSNDINVVAWYDANTTSNGCNPVGTKANNGLGIYDMSGNLLEWCWDKYGTYLSYLQVNPLGPTSGTERVVRGGGWSTYSGSCRVAYRFPGNHYSSNSFSFGFRVCRSIGN